MQGLTFGMEGPNMEGTWYNPHTGDSFTVRNSFFEDNQFIVQTEDGRILKYEQIQEYIKSDKPINIQTPVQAETLPAEVTSILESSYDSNILADDLAMISGNSLGNLHTPTPPAQTEPQGHPEPSFSNFTVMHRCLRRCYHINAHMRPLVVIKVHSVRYGSHDILNTIEPHIFKELVLHRVVYSLSLGIILGVSAFGHAYPYIHPFEQSDIFRTGVLAAAV